VSFSGFDSSVRSFFEGLEDDNSKEYFATHRTLFETSVRDQLYALLEELSAQFGGEVKLFRQTRDVRFSADKSPYKTNTYGILHGLDVPGDGLYASISAGGLVGGSGYHTLAPDQLSRLREAIADGTTGPQLQRLTDGAAERGLELWGASLLSAPRGFPKDHPRIVLLRRKSLALGATLPHGPDGIGRDEALDFLTDTWESAAAVTAWLTEHVGPSELQVQRGRR
jgi:uncharacterized protein (TIGR02453 family)